jgi:Emfourin
LKISFERSGGILGFVYSRTIDTEKLPKSKATNFERLLEQSDFFNLPSETTRLSNNRGAADYYTYNITVEKGTKKHSVKFTDLAKTKDLNELVKSVTRLPPDQTLKS